MSMFRRVLAGLVAVAVVATISFVAVSEDKKAPAAFNEKCPYTGKAVKATADVKIGFCCDNCKGKFEKDVAANIGKVKALDKCPLTGKDTEVSTTVTVGLCCNNCKGKFEKDPVAGLAKFAPAPKASKGE